MAKLQGLPPELLLEIASCVLPDDIESFTAISKHVRRVLQPVIEKHQALKQQFGKTICDGGFGEYPDLLTLLSKLILEPELRHYIKEMRFVYDEAWVSLTSNILNGKEMHPTVRQHVTREIEEWKYYYGPKVDICLLPLLVDLLPSLLTLDLVNPRHRLSQHVDLMLDKGMYSATFPNLQRVNVTVDESTSKRSFSFYTLCCLARLPALEVLMVKGMEHTFGFRSAFFLMGHPGLRLKTLIFKDSVIDCWALANFWGTFRKLKRLEWENSVLVNRTKEGLKDGFSLGVALQMYHKAPTEELILTFTQHHPTSTQPFLEDISGLRTLRTLEAYPEALLETSSGEEAVLPNSPQRMRVNIAERGSQINDLMLFEYLTRLVRPGPYCLPNLSLLELVIVSCGEGLSERGYAGGETRSSEVERLRRCCDDWGVGFELLFGNR